MAEVDDAHVHCLWSTRIGFGLFVGQCVRVVYPADIEDIAIPTGCPRRDTRVQLKGYSEDVKRSEDYRMREEAKEAWNGIKGSSRGGRGISAMHRHACP